MTDENEDPRIAQAWKDLREVQVEGELAVQRARRELARAQEHAALRVSAANRHLDNVTREVRREGGAR